MEIKIREVDRNDKNMILDMYNEYENSELLLGLDRYEGIRDFEKLGEMSFGEWLDDLEKNKDEKNLPEDYSPHTLYLLVDKNDYAIGAIGLRWKEVPILMQFGGLVGYSIRPSKRGKGYATKMLEIGLNKFRQVGKEKILITCKDFNIPSKRVIEKNGGIYENAYKNEKDGYTYLRYWINLK